jgi:hypothetical protein
VALVALATGLGYAAGQDPTPVERGPGEALRAYQRAKIDALGECAKHGFATQWGDVVPDSRVAAECMSIVAAPCGPVSVPGPMSEEPDVGPEI